MRLLGEDVPLVVLLVLPISSPPPLSDGAADCEVSVLITAVSASDFEFEPMAAAPLLVVDCRDKQTHPSEPI